MSAGTISTRDLAERLGRPDLVVVDVRGTAAYNGWRLQGEARGGHIRGAVSVPLPWTTTSSAADLSALLTSKGITPDKTIVVYGYSGDDAATLTRLLRRSGYETALAYESGLPAWAADEALPVERLANYEKLVHPKWLAELVAAQDPATHPGQGFAILEVGAGDRTEYNAGHIPRAVYLDTNLLEAEPLWNRVSHQDLEATLLACGLACGTLTVVYGRDTTAAARAACIFMYAGVRDVRLLDGGLEAWTAAGHSLETTIRRPVPIADFGTTVPGHPEYIIDLPEVKALRAAADAVLVSARTWEEFIGETSGYAYIQPKGRIAGAVWGHAGSGSQPMKYLRNMDNTMRSYHEIAAAWRRRGITPDKRVTFYCGTGWRASEAFFYAYLMGWPNISVYDGGWYEWSQDAANPIELGIPK